MISPLSHENISLLLAVIAAVLLLSSEMLSSYYSRVNILISRKKLRNAAFAVTIAFLITEAAVVITGLIRGQ